jgi:hypothetical protein
MDADTGRYPSGGEILDLRPTDPSVPIRSVVWLGWGTSDSFGGVVSKFKGFNDTVRIIWSVADLLRGDYTTDEYGQVILPLTVLRRLDCLLEPTKESVVATAKDFVGKVDNIDLLLLRLAGQPFYNVSPLNFTRLLDDTPNIATNLRTYISCYSTGAVEVLDKYGFDNQITRLDNAGLLYPVISRFADVDLHPNAVSNEVMGHVFDAISWKPTIGSVRVQRCVAGIERGHRDRYASSVTVDHNN